MLMFLNKYIENCDCKYVALLGTKSEWLQMLRGLTPLRRSKRQGSDRRLYVTNGRTATVEFCHFPT